MGDGLVTRIVFGYLDIFDNAVLNCHDGVDHLGIHLELARMLGGENITATTLKHARELLKTESDPK